jgi:hypothetical protein
VEALGAGLGDRDPKVRARSLRQLCPCRAGFTGYERFLGEVAHLKKDPDPKVRALALHVEADANLIELLETNMEQADRQGWPYSDPDWLRRHRSRWGRWAG